MKHLFNIVLPVIAGLGIVYIISKVRPVTYAELAVNYNLQDTKLPYGILINGTVNGCQLEFMLDTASAITALKPSDTSRCLANLKPSRTQEYESAKGNTATPDNVYNVELQLPDGQPFTTEVSAYQNPTYNVICLKDLLRVYDVNATPEGVQLTPRTQTQTQTQTENTSLSSFTPQTRNRNKRH